MSEFLDAARQYHALGYHPIPCGPQSKRPLIKWQPYQQIQPLLEEIETWWSEWPSANVALVLGRGTFAVDLDGGDAAEQLLNSRFVVLPEGAPRSKTAHGAHVFLAGSVPDRVGLMTTGGAKPQVDIRGVGYVVAPPSIHPDGPRYEWVIPLVPTTELPTAPAGLVALIGAQQPAPALATAGVTTGGAGWVTEFLAGVPQGQRDYACTRLAGYFLGKDLPEETVEMILMRTFAAACTPPADFAMVRKCVRSVGQRERRNAMPITPERPIAAQALTDVLDAWQVARAEPAAIVRTPFYKLNRYLGGGFSAGDLIYIGARPGVGKSAMALEFARSAARDDQAVLFISREMTSIALARRLVTQESGIATTLLKRIDPLPYEDATALTQALLKLRPLPIWLSDEAVAIGEIAALMDAMQSRMAVGLLIVDYLQLVRAPKEIRDRRLQVEAVSENLKMLAVEHKVPTVCLSSLARMEKGVIRRPTLADLRECVTGDTRVLCVDGSRRPIQEVVGLTPDVWTLNEDFKLCRQRAEIWRVGRRSTATVTLASGRSLQATLDHRILAESGWTHVRAIRSGDRVAVARYVPPPECPITWSEDKLVLLAHLVGDGCYVEGASVRYTTASDDNAQAVTRAAHSAFDATVTARRGRIPGANWKELCLATRGNRWHPSRIVLWLKSLGIFGQRSPMKRLPEDIFQLSNAQIALFLRHLWATDGSIGVQPKGRRGSHAVFYATTSLVLAQQVMGLLLRFDIVARLRGIPQRTSRMLWTVHVTGRRAQLQFLDSVGVFGPRCQQADRLQESLKGVRENTNIDTVPRAVWAHVRKSMQHRGISQRAMAVKRGTSYGGTSHFKFAPSRLVLQEYAEILNDANLRRIAMSDLFWDRVLRVDPAAETDVYDLHVPGTHSWLADGIISHNSGELEHDADVVLLLHRQMLEQDTECILAKNREGSPGMIKMLFDGPSLRFTEVPDVL